MNTPLRRTAIAAIVLFAALFVNVNYVQFVQADSLRDNRHNRRVQLDRYAEERGEILAGDKRIVTNIETKSRYRFHRQYPSGPLYAHITGYNSLYYGRTGIEDAYDDVLAGEDESLFASRLSDFITGREPQGAAVRLTIRDSVQRAAAEQLGDRRGAVVAIDPKTGAILAMVSTPTFDPQPITSLDQRKAAAGFDKAKDTPGNALVSKATADTAPRPRHQAPRCRRRRRGSGPRQTTRPRWGGGGWSRCSSRHSPGPRGGCRACCGAPARSARRWARRRKHASRPTSPMEPSVWRRPGRACCAHNRRPAGFFRCGWA